jgi:hypothetical protein
MVHLTYTDVINVCRIYAERKRFSDLESVARFRLAETGRRPGYQYFIGLARRHQGDSEEAAECAFQEQFGMGEWGAFFKEASALFVDVLRDANDSTWLADLREFNGLTIRASNLPWWLKWMRLRVHLIAYRALLSAESKLARPFLCIKEIRHETEVTLCELAGLPMSSPKVGFESIIAQQPDFVPPYIQLAEIEKRAGNIKAARQWWYRAKWIVPSHNFVVDYRGEIEPRTMKVTSTRMAGRMRSWLAKQVIMNARFGPVAAVLLNCLPKIRVGSVIKDWVSRTAVLFNRNARDFRDPS